MLTKFDTKNNFISRFNPQTGLYMRTGVIKDGKDTGVDPYMCDYPELIDVGIMGHCIHGRAGLCIQSGVQCYQNGLGQSEPNMKLSDYRRIVDESKGLAFQFALGGRGDPNKHKDFEEILRYSRKNSVVPNYTTSGLDLTDTEIAITKQYTGSVAVSWYRAEYTIDAIKRLVKAGCSTNIHYVLGNSSIEEAHSRLVAQDFPHGVNAVIFLLHKPVGQGTQDEVIKVGDPRLAAFFKEVDKGNREFKVGFDSCTVPGIVNFSRRINLDSVEACDAGRFSMYITSDMKATPCSFDNQGQRWAVSLNEMTIQEAWYSPLFENFRGHSRHSCTGCGKRSNCYGGCPITPEITLCASEHRHIPGVQGNSLISLGLPKSRHSLQVSQ